MGINGAKLSCIRIKRWFKRTKTALELLGGGCWLIRFVLVFYANKTVSNVRRRMFRV
jgi:hypothetical protein